MRNFKRVLSLLLVLVMCLGLVTAASAASYDDMNGADKVTYTEAMDVLVALGIIQGTSTGLEPDATFSREQAAKIISYICLGSTAAEALAKTGGVFSDVEAGRWSAGYIAYCANAGIINGTGDGKFNPTGNVTGYEFAKMLLGALGYGENDEFVGTYWKTNVASYGYDIGLFDDLDSSVNLANAATRQEAMLYAFNALQAMTVSYSDVLGAYYSGSSILKDIDEDDEYLYTLGYKVFGLYKSTTGTDGFGREYYTWKVSKKSISDKYYEDAALSYTSIVYSSTLYSDLGSSYAGKATYYLNGEKQDNFPIQKGLTSKSVGGYGMLTYVYTEDDSYDVTIISISTYLGQVTDVDDDEVTVEVYDGKGEVGGAHTVEATGFEDDDYVVVTIADDEIETIESAVTFTGIMEAKGSSYLKVSGTAYYKNNSYGALTEAEDANDYSGTYTFITDANGYLLGNVLYEEGEDTSTSSYILVKDSEYSTSLASKKAAVEVQYLDGTTDVVYLKLTKSGDTYYWSKPNGGTNGTTTTKTKLEGESGKIKGLENGFYRYTEDSNGYITLKLLSTNSKKAVGRMSTSIATNTSNKNISIDGSAINLYTNSATKLYVIDEDGDVTTVTGYSNFKGYEDENVNVLIFYSGSLVSSIYVFDGSYTSDTTYAWYTGSYYTNSNGTYYTFYVEGEEVDYELDDSLTVPSYYGLYSIKVSSGVITELNSAMTYAGAQKVTRSRTSYFTVSGGTSYYYDDDVEIYDGNNGGGTASVSSGDYVVYAIEDGLVVCVYIVPDPSAVEEEDTSSSSLKITDLALTKNENETATISFTANKSGKTVYLVVESYASAGYTTLYETSATTDTTSNTVNFNTNNSTYYRISVYANSAHTQLLAQTYG